MPESSFLLPPASAFMPATVNRYDRTQWLESDLAFISSKAHAAHTSSHPCLHLSNKKPVLYLAYSHLLFYP